ncbi:MAG TPA: long-chain fatty acid--CoA ligase [Kofleriaceae bacterium]
MAVRADDSIPRRLLSQAAQRPSSIAYQAKVGGAYQPTTWRTFVDQVRRAARALIGLGFPRGGTVAILGFNRPEWAILDHATMMAGGAPAGIYTTCSPDEVAYIISHAESSIVLVENAAQLAKVTARRAQLPKLAHVILMAGATATDGALAWDAFLAKGDAVSDADVDARIDQIQQADLATLIYTSGTTGPPKGVMLSHENLSWTAQALVDVGGGTANDVSLSYLPLSHIAEQMATVHMPATAGSSVYFAESIDKLADNLKESRPTVFFGVPRIWEKFHSVLAGRLAEQKGVKGKLVAWARDTCARVNALLDEGKQPGAWLSAQHRLANRLVIGKLKVALGFDRARALISGAAPIAPDVLAFFATLDLPIREIYGQSEDSGPTSYNLPGKTKLGSVGPAFPGIEVKLAPDGEILIKGANVFMGYYKDAAATADVLHDGWLASGDLGAFDADGFLTITGRKKEIIITAGGKNIAPKNIEAAIKQLSIVGEAVVIGDRRKFLTALVTIDPEAKLAPADARAQIQQQIDRVNETLARVEQVKKFAVLPKPFGIDSGELTPTLKIKRTVVATLYAREIDAMYADGGE